MLIAPSPYTEPPANAVETLEVSEKPVGCPVTLEMLDPAVIPGKPNPLPPKNDSVCATALDAFPLTGAVADADTLCPTPAFDVLVAVATPELAPLKTVACAEAWPDPSAVAFDVALADPA